MWSRSSSLFACLCLLVLALAASPAHAASQHASRPAAASTRDLLDDGGDAQADDVDVEDGSVDDASGYADITDCLADDDGSDPGYDDSTDDTGDDDTGDDNSDTVYDDSGDDSSDDTGFDDTGDGDCTDAAAPALPLATVPLPAPPTPAIPRIPAPAQPRFVHLHANGTVWVSPKLPRTVRAVIAAANRIAKLPYRYGGGHGSFTDRAYDCSGSVSYALHGGGLLNATLTSGMLEHWGAKGAGRWITVYANAGHTFMLIAGMRFDTVARAQWGSRWMIGARWTRGYVVRHPPGL
jgi:hypothetical protein